MKTKMHRLCSSICILGIAASLSLSVFANTEQTKSLNTSYGKLTGTSFVVEEGNNWHTTSVLADVDSGGKTFNKMVQSLSYKNYKTGSTFQPKTEYVEYNTNTASQEKDYQWDSAQNPKTIYCTHEVRHTKAYGVSTTLVKV